MKTRTTRNQIEEILSDPSFCDPSMDCEIRVKRLEGMTILLAERIDMIAVDELNELRHHRDTTVGLYAFDQDINAIFEDLPESEKECKTVVEAYLVQQINYLKGIIFQIA
ncbi:hypothetical protein LCGC14_2495540 [marine sediment metagenome]|uniref:Uncharacterized protein n=1 Tax=marine sediment metagenome TaxID=412755 RepID=A0A0F9DX96_9ZZZZ